MAPRRATARRTNRVGVDAKRGALALGGIGLSATAFVFVFISEHQPLFGFQDYGDRAAIITALAAEAATIVL